jgi:hypothetical protein
MTENGWQRNDPWVLVPRGLGESLTVITSNMSSRQTTTNETFRTGFMTPFLKSLK